MRCLNIFLALCALSFAGCNCDNGDSKSEPKPDAVKAKAENQAAEEGTKVEENAKPAVEEGTKVEENAKPADDAKEVAANAAPTEREVFVPEWMGEGKTKPETRVLVAYYSHSGNTAAVAKMIAEETGAALYEIVPETAYPADYNTVVAQAKVEIQNNVRPALKSAKILAKDFDVFYIGTPNWWGTMAPPVATFINELAADDGLEGKSVMPFLTHGSGGKQRVCSDIEGLSIKAAVKECFAAEKDSAKSEDVKTWIGTVTAK